MKSKKATRVDGIACEMLTAERIIAIEWFTQENRDWKIVVIVSLH